MYNCYRHGCEHFVSGLCPVCGLVGYCHQTCLSADWHRHHHQAHGLYPLEHLADEVLPGIWIGSIESLRAEAFMANIQAVVSVIPCGVVDEEMLSEILHRKHHLRIPIEDQPYANIIQYFEMSAAWIREHRLKGENILVHCIGGHSRSTTLLIYYMLRYMKFTSVFRALDELKTKRPTVHPNPGFMWQLEEAFQQLPTGL